MAGNYPYAGAPKRIGTVFERIAKTGVPPKVDQKWLEGQGFTSSTDRSMLRILRHLGFIDANGAPSELWRDYRGADPKGTLGRAIRQGYSRLYETFPDADRNPNEQLTQFVRSDSGLDDEVAAKAVGTFKTLVELADMRRAERTPPDVSQVEFGNGAGAVAPAAPPAVRPASTPRTYGAGVTVNVNLQLTLPESTDPAVYDALFASLKKHVLSGTDDGA